MKISKVVIPAAGFGTRFLPVTKAIPKELLPLLNKPAIHYIVDEAKASKIDNFVIITAKGKEAIQHYFSPDAHLYDFLKEKGKQALIKDLDALLNTTKFSYITQSKALGLGHAVSLARAEIKSDFFGVILPDDIIFGDEPGLYQLIEIAEMKKAMVIAVQEVPNELISSYGVIKIKVPLENDLYEVEKLVEKPQAKDAPSNLAVIGRYVLSSHIFDALEKIKPSSGGELQLTDALSLLLEQGHRIFAYKIRGTRFDVGTPSGWLKANIQLGMLNGIHLT